MMSKWCAPRRGSEPAVVVEVRRDRTLVEDLGLRKFTQHRADPGDVTDPAIAHHGCSFAKSGIGTLLGSGLQHPATSPCGFNQLPSLADRQGERFFAIDILARQQGGLGDRGVPVIRRADENGVDVRA